MCSSDLEGSLSVITLGRGYAWLDTGTVDSMNEATDFVRVIESRTGVKVAALEEIGYRNGWIDKGTLESAAQSYGKSPYGVYLHTLAKGRLWGGSCGTGMEVSKCL